jgi:uncharacterized OB-fold protein
MDRISNKLIGAKCKKCGKLYIPPIYVCLKCNQTEFGEVELSGRGSVRTYTTIRVPPLGFEEQVPYNIAIIGLEEGINVTARIVDKNDKELSIGTAVVFTKKEDGVHWFASAS